MKNELNIAGLNAVHRNTPKKCSNSLPEELEQSKNIFG